MTFIENVLASFRRLISRSTVHGSSTEASTDLSKVPPRSFLWLDRLKALAMIGVILNHMVERVFKYPQFSNPTQNWGTLADRVAQVITPVSGYGWGDVPLTVLRNVGWLGDQGVQLFLIASGFGLAWSQLQRKDSSWRSFYQRRLWKLYPLWWGTHGLFLIVSLFLKKGMALNQPELYLSLLGFRITPETFYYFSPSWWFVGLLIQLYLIFPLLYGGLKRWGAVRFWVGTSAIALIIRGVGLYLLGDPYLDLWSRGNIFITRLPEFVLGMSLAAGFYSNFETTNRWFRSRRLWFFGILIYALGLAGAFTLWGMSVSPVLLGVGLLIMLYPALNQPWMDRLDRSGLRWIGQHSYTLFLVHHPIVMRVLPEGDPSIRTVFGGILSIIVMVVFTLLIEWGVTFLGQRLSLNREH